jgi:hypothetical protein
LHGCGCKFHLRQKIIIMSDINFYLAIYRYTKPSSS